MNSTKRRILFLMTCLMLAATFASTAQADDTVTVTATLVSTEALTPQIPAAGTVFSRHEAEVTAGLAGRLSWVAEPGDVIAEGEPVARFDCEALTLRREEQAAIAEREAIATAALAREAERLEQLNVRLVAATTQVDRTRADRDLAGAELKIARVRTRQIDAELKRCVARAPFTGVVTQQQRRAGEDIDRNTVIASLTDVTNLEVRAAVPVRHLPRVRRGSVTQVMLGELVMEGRIRKTVPAADPLSQTFELRIDLPAQAASVLAAGQLVSVKVPLVGDAAMTVPRDALVLRDDGTFVVRIDANDEAQRVPVTIAEASGERVAVRGKLAPGDRIAVRGAGALSDGQAVRVAPGS